MVLLAGFCVAVAIFSLAAAVRDAGVRIADAIQEGKSNG